MSSAKAHEAPTPAVILEPYRRDSDAMGHRRARIWASIALGLFSIFWGMVFAFLAPALIVILMAPVVILFLLALWAMPDFAHAPNRAIASLFFTYLVALIIWPFYISISIPHSGLPWISLTRLIDVPLAIVFLTSLSVSKELRSQVSAILAAEKPIAIMFILFTVTEAYSILLSDRMFASLNKWADAQIGWTCMFFVACYLFSQPGRVRQWAGILWVCAVITGVIGVWEWRLKHVPWLGHLPAFLQMDPLTIQQMMPGYRSYTTIYRVQSTFQGAIGLGEYMSMAMPFVLHIAFNARQRAVRIAAILTLALIGFVTFISHARSGLLGLLIGFGLYFLYWGVLQWRRRPQGLIGPAVVLTYPITAIGAVAATFLVGHIRAAVWGSGEAVNSSLARQVQYQMGLPKILANPVGHGIGRAGDTLGFFDPGGLMTIDTYYLTVALEYGVLGFVAFFGMIIYAIYTSGRYALRNEYHDSEISFLAPAAISLCTFLTIKSIYSEQTNHPIFFMTMGLVMALVYRLKFERQAEASSKAADVDQRAGPRRLVTPAHQPARP